MKNSNQNVTKSIESTLNFIYFCSNFPHDFIDKAFNSDLANHLKSKFTGDVTKFMREYNKESYKFTTFYRYYKTCFRYYIGIIKLAFRYYKTCF